MSDMKLIMEGWRGFLQEDAIGDAGRAKMQAGLEMAKRGASAKEILAAQDDGSAEFAKIKDLLVAAEKQKEAALKNLASQEKEDIKRAKQHTAEMEKLKNQILQVAQQSNNPAAAKVAAAEQAEIQKLKQKAAATVRDFNKRMDSATDAAPVPDFDGDSGQPLTKKGEQLCAKNPRCFDEFIKPDIASGGQTGFSGQTGQPLKDLIAIAQQNKG